MHILNITKNKFLFLICSIGIVLICTFFFLNGSLSSETQTENRFAIGNSDAARRAFIESYQIQLSPLPPALENYTVSETFPQGDEEYECLQNEMGLSLCPYRGRTLLKYTYEMTNHPESFTTPVYVNLFMSNGIVVAADVCAPHLTDGFVKSLEYFR